MRIKHVKRRSDIDVKKPVYSISSDSEDDPIPRTLRRPVRNHRIESFNGDAINDDVNSFHHLCRRSMEQCEFCDSKFSNRYQCLIHTAKHIIIPLINQKVAQCPECLFHFNSIEKLRRHCEKHHNITYKEELEQTVIEEKPKISRNVKLKSRILFEDDLNEGLLSDLTTDCKVNIELFNVPFLDDETHNNPLGLEKLNDVCGKMVNDIVNGMKSVHYEDLMRPGLYRCRRCGKSFPNRCYLIQHEATHIRLKKPRVMLCRFCEIHYPTVPSLIRHLRDSHKEKEESHSNLSTQTCSECNLKYHNLKRHERRYHNYERFVTSSVDHRENRLENSQDRSEDSDVHVNYKDIKVCDVCYSFLRNKENLKYVYLGAVQEIGVQQVCQNCNHKFFEVNLVRVVTKFRNSYKPRSKLRLSNTDRLKNIQKRLKVIKLMHRF